MARIVLHIGTHKTATTTIQNVFHRNATLLAQHGIVYPRLGTATGWRRTGTRTCPRICAIPAAA